MAEPELAAHRPAMERLVTELVAHDRADGLRVLSDAAPFAQIAGVSIDYTVMENTARAAMVPADMGWSDIGNWAALAEALTGETEALSKQLHLLEIRGGWGRAHPCQAPESQPAHSATSTLRRRSSASRC